MNLQKKQKYIFLVFCARQGLILTHIYLHLPWRISVT